MHSFGCSCEICVSIYEYCIGSLGAETLYCACTVGYTREQFGDELDIGSFCCIGEYNGRSCVEIYCEHLADSVYHDLFCPCIACHTFALFNRFLNNN